MGLLLGNGFDKKSGSLGKVVCHHGVQLSFLCAPVEQGQGGHEVGKCASFPWGGEGSEMNFFLTLQSGEDRAECHQLLPGLHRGGLG